MLFQMSIIWIQELYNIRKKIRKRENTQKGFEKTFFYLQKKPKKASGLAVYQQLRFAIQLSNTEVKWIILNG